MKLLCTLTFACLTFAFSLALSSGLITTQSAFAQQSGGTVILEDDFSRTEKDDSKEEVGNDWGTNSKKRAKGVKQVDLADGAMHVTKAKVADHGVSVTHEVAFRDATIRMRFKLGKGDDLGINIADMKEKSVHAGHICVARIRLDKTEISDLKTGVMDLETRKRRLAKTATKEDTARIKNTKKLFKHKIEADKWHQLEVNIAGDVMSVSIDNKKVGTFKSPGIAHPTKSRLRLSVNKSAWIDNVKVIRQTP